MQSSQSTLLRDDYAVIILNTDNVELEPLLYEYFIQVQTQKRRAINAISSETVNMIILSEKGKYS